MPETRSYLDRVKKETGLELSNIARKAGLSPETLTRPYNNKDHASAISIKSLRKIQESTGIRMPSGMDVDPPVSSSGEDAALAIKIFNALPSEGVKLTEAIKLNIINQILEIVKRHKSR